MEILANAEPRKSLTTGSFAVVSFTGREMKRKRRSTTKRHLSRPVSDFVPRSIFFLLSAVVFVSLFHSFSFHFFVGSYAFYSVIIFAEEGNINYFFFLSLFVRSLIYSFSDLVRARAHRRDRRTSGEEEEESVRVRGNAAEYVASGEEQE